MRQRKKCFFVFVFFFWLTGTACAEDLTHFLAFQIFTGSLDSTNLRQSFPPPPQDLRQTVIGLKNRIGTTGNDSRKLGFVLGLISLDNSDEDVRRLIANGFDIALETDTAVGFHIDDSMFWGRLQNLNTHDNIEWLDWQGTPNTGRRLDWSEKPTKIMPQLCINSKKVRDAVSDRATVIGDEIAKGLKKLEAAHKSDLFIGVIAGSETQIGRDYETGKYLGYCALTNAGYSEKNPPEDASVALGMITKDFITFWARSLVKSGVPASKIFSHIAYMSSTWYAVDKMQNPAIAPYLQTVNFTPPPVAFCDGCIPGFSTYPQPGHLEQWQDVLKQHGSPPWASAEGTAMDPGVAEHSAQGMDMENYLGNLFNHGAVLVNIYGWGVGDTNNPFRKIAEGDNALKAYRKFLSGGILQDAPIPVPHIPPAGFIDKMHKIQATLPGWIDKNGPAKVKDAVETLQKSMAAQQFDAADQAADSILKIIGQ